MSILDNHAIITNEGGKVFLKKGSANAKILVNGVPLSGQFGNHPATLPTSLPHPPPTPADDAKELHQYTRVLFGQNHMYVFEHPGEHKAGKKAGKKYAKAPTWEEAQAEIVENSGLSFGSGSKADLVLQEEIISLLPHVNEANAISDELGKSMFFELVLISAAARGEKNGKTKVMVGDGEPPVSTTHGL